MVLWFHVSTHRFVCDIIEDHFNYKFIEKKLFHEYEYESEYGSNAFELVAGVTHIGLTHTEEYK